MQHIEEIAERIRQSFEGRTSARDRALAQTRILVRHCANAIRAIHRNDHEITLEHLAEAKSIVENLRNDLTDFPDLYFAGYTQDALKEYGTCKVTCVSEPLFAGADGALKLSQDMPSKYWETL